MPLALFSIAAGNTPIMDCSHLLFVFLTFIEMFQKVFYVDRECLLLQGRNVLYQIAGALVDTLFCPDSFLDLGFCFLQMYQSVYGVSVYRSV